jgi:hypothetical protein
MTDAATTPLTKRCRGCGTDYPRSPEHFHVRPEVPDGFRARCRRCANKYRRERTSENVRLAQVARELAGERVRRPAAPPAPIPAEPIGDDEVTDGRIVVPPEPMTLSTEEPERAERYVFTYAQNATPAHAGFLAALRVFCRERNARLVVLPGRYKNPTSVVTKDQEHDEWWAAELAPFLFAGRMTIGRLTVYGDISIQPTAARPVSGFEVFAGHNSAIFGHPKIEYKTVPSNQRHWPRILTSTGACTVPNYVSAKAGKKGEAHHTIGACVVERDPRLFHIRQIYAAPDGSFTDLDREYTPTGSRAADRPESMTTADVHEIKMDPLVDAASFRGPSSICGFLRPKRLIYHDLLDFDTRNHHTRGDFQNRYARAMGWKNDVVEVEVARAIDFLDRTPEDIEPIVVRSNHDAAYDRWLKEADFREDPVNARFYVETWKAMLDEFDRTGAWPDAFELLYRQR